MRRLIVNADDFGMSAAVNRGIIAAHAGGVVTSATLLANGEAFAEAVALARAHPALGIGVHLNLVEGRPVAPAAEVGSLLGPGGAFLGAAWPLAVRRFAQCLERRHLVTELRAQIQRVVDAGLRPTHVDSHMHAHCLPAVHDAVLEAARHFGIRRLRCPAEAPLSRSLSRGLAPGSRVRSALVGRLASRHRAELARRGMRTTDHFLGPRLMGRLEAPLLARLLPRIGRGVTELMVHPAESAGAARHIRRDRELEALRSPAVAAAIEEGSIELVSFAAL